MTFANWSPVTFNHVQQIKGFWHERIVAVRGQTARICLDQCESTGRLANFRRAARREEGPFQGRYYNDSDVYKVLEGIAYLLMDERDLLLEAEADAIIDDICAAQWEDGYINTFFSLTNPLERWTDMAKHEDYCIGHMVEAAIAYYQATGKDKWLNSAIRAVEHMMGLFGPGKRHWVVGHQEPELALIRLWRLTGRVEFLDFASWLIEERGKGHLQSAAFERLRFRSDYVQDDVPARHLHKVVGHAVRAMYYYSAIADISMIQGDEELRAALLRLWDNVVPANLYITGGIGQEAQHEGFTRDFHKPNLTAYCETCAAIGMAFWNQRMNLMEGDARYADLVEQELYNGILSGISMKGDLFFYENPLASVGTHNRQPWYDCSCCPTNLIRFIPSVGGYIFASDNDTLVINQFIPSEAKVPIAGKETTVIINTDYPWNGNVRVMFPHVGACRQIKIRKPGWCKAWEVTVNLKPVYPSEHQGYLELPVISGDIIRFTMDMPVRKHRDDDRVMENAGRAAFTRGPLVYCAEEIDNPGYVSEYFHAEVSEGNQEPSVGSDPSNSGITTINIGECTLVPYFYWNNRGSGAMAVWLKTFQDNESP
jgi:DUF1680 family protein